MIDTYVEDVPPEATFAQTQSIVQRAYQKASGLPIDLAEDFVPAMQATYDAATRSRALVRSLRVLTALQARAGDKGVPKLSDLGLPGAATLDPYNGQPLRVKRLAEGWLVYSVGKNLTDDGGKFEDFSDAGLGPPPAVRKSGSQ